MSYQPPVTHPVFFDVSTVNNPALRADGVGVYISKLAGWDDTAEIRDTREPRPGLDGEIARNVLLSGRTVTVEGFVQGNGWTDLQSRKDTLRRMFVPTTTEKVFKLPKGTYSGTPPTTYAASMADFLRIHARVLDPIVFEESLGGFGQSFQVSIRSADPRRYSDTLTTGQTTDLPEGGGVTSPVTSPVNSGSAVTGGEVIVVNNGDYETPHLLRMYGPVSNPVAEDISAGAWKVQFDGLVVANGDYVEVDMLDRTAYLNGRDDLSGNNLLKYVDHAETTWGMLAAGSTTIRYSGIGIANPAYLYVEFRDANA